MLKFKKLDIFIAKQFLVLFVGAFFICLFVLMMQFLWRYVDDLIGKGLSMEVLAKFFWYMALMLMPQAFPLAILLSSLITFGNLGESSELTAIKAAGISLMQSFRSLIVISILICLCSFYFQNVIGPKAQGSLTQLLLSMKQKSPELEIPEGVFYDGIPNSNLYVQRKDLNTGMLYGVMIYRMTGSYEDQAIILADSGQLQSTAEKKHLLLKLYSGEWFENMRSQELAGNANVPYRRETFFYKTLIFDFDGNFNLADGGVLAGDARSKGLSKIVRDVDSLTIHYDSVGRRYYEDAMKSEYRYRSLSKQDSAKALKLAMSDDINLDSIWAKLPADRQKVSINEALSMAKMAKNQLEYKSFITKDADSAIRKHKVEAIRKFTMSLCCLIFFFIGAPLGAIIRKGGLGVPVILSVLVFIFYYILDNTGYTMAKKGMWNLWFGMLISTVVLTPLAIFVTYKANNDSVVFNMDMYRTFFRKLFGLRLHRTTYGKEVIINDPDYAADKEKLEKMTSDVEAYSKEHKLVRMPDPVKVFFKYEPDHKIEEISEELESVIEDLSNSKNKKIVGELDKYPILSTKAHTRPFERKWMNIVAAVIIPVGLFLYLRMWRFRMRLFRDLHVIRQLNSTIIGQIDEMNSQKK